MNILAVDDERNALEVLERAILKAIPGCTLLGAQSSEEALAHAESHQIDVAFLDIRIDELSGLQLAKRLKEIYGNTNIVFVTGYDEYMLDALRMHVSGYLQKPVSPGDIEEELRHLRHPVVLSEQGVHIRTFGSFEVFVDGSAVHFGRSKSKEILAYLVDRRGAGASRKELAAILWEDGDYSRKRQGHLQILIHEMKRALREAGAGDIVIQEKGRLYLDAQKVECDYYRFDQWDAQAVNSYHGEYMSEYSWAEFTAGALNQRLYSCNK